MNIWKSIHLKDVGPFKNVTFNIPKGITTIYGCNGRSSNSNAAGKSMLFSSIFDTLYESPVAAEKSDRLRSGVRAVSMQVGETPLLVKRVGSKSSLKYGDKVVHGVVKVRKELDQVLPWSWEDVVTYIHLDSQVPHPLVKGTNAHRKQFLTKFFNLDRIDVEKKIIKSELDRLSKVQPEYDFLTDELKRTSRQLPPEGVLEKLIAKQASYRAELERLQSDASELELKRKAAIFKDQASKEIEHYRNGTLESGVKNPSRVYAFYVELLAEQKGLLEEARRYQEFKDATAAYEKWLGQLAPETLEFMSSGELEDPEVKARQVIVHEQKLSAIGSRLRKIQRQCAVKLPVALKPNRPLHQCLSKLESLEHQIEHAKKFGKGQCPTCGQSVKVESLDELHKRVKSVKAVIRQWDVYEAYVKERKEQELLRDEYRSLRNQITECKAFIVANQHYRVVSQDLADPMEPPEPFRGKKIDYATMQKMVAEIQERVDALQFLMRHKELLRCALKPSTELDAGSLERVADLSRMLVSVEAKIERANSLVERVKEIKERLAELTPKIRKISYVKELLEGYDDKAMKRLVIQAISTRLMQQVNKYAKLVFNDDFRFELVWDSSQVQLLVHRHFQDRVDTSDVRRLSGAETKLFTIVLVLAMLSFVPSHKRSSMIVLDEPTANFSAANRALFEELLPVVNKVIPSIVIITPRTEERYGGHEFTITKNGGNTQIVKGHPSDRRSNA